MRKFAREFRDSSLKAISRKKHGKKPAEVLEAEKIITKFREEQKNLEFSLPRLDSLECSDSVCPKCFYLHGLTSELTPIDGDDLVDRFRCKKCRSIYEEEA
jgi:hypothetical protein